MSLYLERIGCMCSSIAWVGRGYDILRIVREAFDTGGEAARALGVSPVIQTLLYIRGMHKPDGRHEGLRRSFDSAVM